MIPLLQEISNRFKLQVTFCGYQETLPGKEPLILVNLSAKDGGSTVVYDPKEHWLKDAQKVIEGAEMAGKSK